MPDDPDGQEFEAWASINEVRDVFGALRYETLAIQRDGYLGLPDRLDDDQVRVLAANLARMPGGRSSLTLAERAAEVLDDMRRPEAERRFPEWGEHDWILRGRDGRGDPQEAGARCRHYAVAQALAMDAAAWPDAARAVLFTGIQHALHDAMRDGFDRREPMITEKIIAKIEATFEHRIIRFFRLHSVSLPGRNRLDLGTASMQENHDMLAADLAVVMGLRIHGRELYRIVLFQAKNADSNGKFDISSKIASQQLDKLLSTGMGWYIFYPGIEGNFSFNMTVRPAAEIFQDVFSTETEPRYRAAFNVGGRQSPAWDFATFVSVAMTSRNPYLGRLFPDAVAAADALSIERKRPLARRALVADLTGALDVHKLVARLAQQGYGDERAFAVPTARDPSDTPDDDGTSVDPSPS